MSQFLIINVNFFLQVPHINVTRISLDRLLLARKEQLTMAWPQAPSLDHLPSTFHSIIHLSCIAVHY